MFSRNYPVKVLRQVGQFDHLTFYGEQDGRQGNIKIQGFQPVFGESE